MKECPKDGYKDGEGSKGETCEARLSSAQSRGGEGRPHGGCSSSQGAEGQR